jgi:hypothetical protein
MKLPTEHPMKKYRDLDRARGKKRVNVTLTAEEYQFLLSRSAQAGESPTAYLKNAALHQMADKRQLTAEELECFRSGIIEIRRIGNNLNQIAHAANSGIAFDPKEIRQLLGEMEKVIKERFTK